MRRQLTLALFMCLGVTAVSARAQDLPLRDPFGGDLTEGLDELLQQPESDAADAATLPSQIAGPVDQLLGLMEQAAEQLGAGVTGPPTQQVQQSIVSQLDGWLSRNGSGSQSSGSESRATEQQRPEPSASSAESSQADGEQSQQSGEQQESGEAGGEIGQGESADSSGGDSGAPGGSESSAADPAEGGQGDEQVDAGSGASAEPGRAADVDPNPSGGTATGGDVWGHLPPRVRDRVRSISPEDYLPQYRKAIEEYFKRIAEQGG